MAILTVVRNVLRQNLRVLVCKLWRVLVVGAGLVPVRGWGPVVIRGYSRGSSNKQHISSRWLLWRGNCNNDRLHCGGLSGSNEQHLATRNIYRRGHNSNATDTQHINIFQSIKIFFRLGSSLTWRPDDLAAQLGQAAGAGHGGNPGPGGHLNLNMTASWHVTRGSLGHVAPCPRLVIRMKCWNICWIQHICGRRDSMKMATLSSSWMSDFWVCFVLKCIY